ncbi:MAG: hypothetical protein SV760_06260, partial [Halobacteria archaeon]|nr:hypothetical protein [Halobacteria archaeon]
NGFVGFQGVVYQLLLVDESGVLVLVVDTHRSPHHHEPVEVGCSGEFFGVVKTRSLNRCPLSSAQSETRAGGSYGTCCR